MGNFIRLFGVGIFGLLGVYGRYALNGLAPRMSLELPLLTLMINVVGSFLIGGLYAASMKAAIGEDLRVSLMVGLLGGFTTFSAFSLEAITLLSSGRYLFGIFYVLGSVVGGLVGCFAGIAAVTAILGS